MPDTTGLIPYEVVPSDVNDLEFVARFVVAGVDGTLRYLATGGQRPVTLAIIAGRLYPVVAKRIFRTGTTPAKVTVYVSPRNRFVRAAGHTLSDDPGGDLLADSSGDILVEE